jgi:hypothetical protein
LRPLGPFSLGGSHLAAALDALAGLDVDDLLVELATEGEG